MSDEIKFGLTSDIHWSPRDPYSHMAWPQPGGAANSGEWRVPATGLIRTQAAADDFYAVGISRWFDLGDWIDIPATGSEDTVKDYLDDVIALVDASDYVTLGGGVIAAITGNWEDSYWNSSAIAHRTDWVSKWDASCHVTRANTYSIADAGGNEAYTEPMGYTYEYDGIRFVMVGYVAQDCAEFGPSTTAWIAARAAETTLPVIVCSHVLGEPGMPFHTQGFQDMLVANVNIIMVIIGHDHRGMRHNLIHNARWEQYPESYTYNPEVSYCQDVIIFVAAGGIRPIENASRYDPCPAGTTWGVNDSCHYVISVKPGIYQGVNRKRANVAIQGFYQAEKHTKGYDKFLSC